MASTPVCNTPTSVPTAETSSQTVLPANQDFVLEKCEGTYHYSIARDTSTTEQYVSIVAINGDAKGITMTCTDGIEVTSQTALTWFYTYGIGLAEQQGWQTVG